MPRSADAEVKRTAIGAPVPSPNTHVLPRAVVTRNVPRRIIDLSAMRHNRSIGDLRLIDAIRAGTTGERLRSLCRCFGRMMVPAHYGDAAGQQIRVKVN